MTVEQLPSNQVKSAYRKVPGADQGVARSVRRWLYRMKYDFLGVRRRYAGRWAPALILFAFQVAMPVYVFSLTHAAEGLSTVIVILCLQALANAVVLFDSTTTRSRVVGRLKSDRKLQTASILDRMAAQFPPVRVSPGELETLRKEILQTIASCVAGPWNLDVHQVVASLVVRHSTDPDVLAVISRSDSSRPAPVMYPKHAIVAWRTFDDGDVHVTSDVHADYDGFESAKYCSVISLPVSTINAKVAAAVSIDHPDPFLFDGRELLIQTSLQPYVRMLAMTLSNFSCAENTAAEGGGAG